MRATKLAFALLSAIALTVVARGQDRTFGDFDCTQDCSGHSAGYGWADKHGIDDESECPDGNSQSFHEGCVAYTRNPNMGANQDADSRAWLGSPASAGAAPLPRPFAKSLLEPAQLTGPDMSASVHLGGTIMYIYVRRSSISSNCVCFGS